MFRMLVTLIAGVSAVCIFLFCADSPTDPFSPENARISLLLKSSTFQESDTTVTDTVGKTIQLGLCLYLTQHIDSTVITVSASSKIDTEIVCRKKNNSIDSAYYDLVFSTPGTHTVSAIAYVGKDLRQATAKIHIITRPTLNRKPELTVTGARTVDAGQACTLSVSVYDPDSGQMVTVDTLRSPQGSAFSDTVFTWLPAVADTGSDTVIFIVRDNGSPVLTDTAIVPITVKLLKVNHPPTWSSDAIDLTGTVGWPVSLPFAGNSSDPDNDTLSFVLLSGAPDGDTVLNGIYSFTPAPAHEGTFYPRVIVRDPQRLSYTLVIKLTISPADTTPPALRRLSPSEDSATISASSCQVRVSATDKSGVRSVRCFKAMDSITVSRSDTVYSATVAGIIQNQYTKVTFIAIDSSRAANACTLSVYITRDSTMLDAEGPVIFQKSGPASGTVITDSVISITDSILDPSGVDSVYWTLNNIRAGTMTLVSGSTTNYTLRDTLSKYRINRLVIHATDRSSRGNRDSSVMVLDYNLPPIINDTAVAFDRNTAKTWTLSAESRDNDSLFWSRLSSPSSLSGTVTDTLPSVTFTPANNWSGTDSFYVRVTDGYWNDTAKVKITVVDVPVAPDIVTQPQGLTRMLGQAAAFSVTINPDVNPAPTYQWKRNGNAITGANAASFSIGAVASEDSGSYTVTVSNVAGTVTSQPALLNVQYAPVIMTQPQSQTLYLGQAATFVVAARGNPAPIYQWKRNGSAIAGQTSASYTINSPGVGDSGKYTVSVMNSVDTVESDTARFFARLKDIAAGQNHSLILKTDGTVWACGFNPYGQLGDGTTNNNSILHQIRTIDNVQKVAAGAYHSLFLKNNGTVWVCGAGNYIGVGNLDMFTTPVESSIRNVKDVSAGTIHSQILKNDGTLWAFGNNNEGQLGDGTKESRMSPVQALNINAIQQICVGESFSLAIQNDGTLWGCGSNNNGQLGNEAISKCSTFVQNPNINDLKITSARGAHTLLVKNDATLWVCGYNGSGQLGDGSTDSHPVPTRIMSMSDILNISAGDSHSLFLKKDGTLWVCGSNSNGQLGDSTIFPFTDIPKKIADSVQTIAAGGWHSLFLKKDGSLWGCGSNGRGQLGTGDSTNRKTPVRITF